MSLSREAVDAIVDRVLEETPPPQTVDALDEISRRQLKEEAETLGVSPYQLLQARNRQRAEDLASNKRAREIAQAARGN